MPIRVIAGSAKGRRLKMVPGDTVRPIMDRVKEALFSIIGRDILGATVLDLFAGTGSVGIEALSRGAASVTFVDLDRKAIQTIRDNLELTRLADRAIVRRANAFDLLKNPPDRPYDLIYVAPPQYKRLWVDTLLALEENPAWIPAGVSVIVQIDPAEAEDVPLTRLRLVDERRYGKTLLRFYIAEDVSNGEVTD
ncbi:MAG: 16S rRNA (guanine(966)-N(2))-methyltransferase RsmD [Chloroflexota bacterium]|nr:MAG: 16S rRNA (guanine(966)-N(2))-methyltransferase RsmD [Chloroflexota bacterium]